MRVATRMVAEIFHWAYRMGAENEDVDDKQLMPVHLRREEPQCLPDREA